jgi:hypothetical protein
VTFSFNPSLPTNRDKVRLRLGDTNAEQKIFEDETIDALLVSNGQSVGKTLIECAKHVIALLSRPDYTADWLKVSHSEARQSWLRLLAQFESEYSVDTKSISVKVGKFTRRD